MRGRLCLRKDVVIAMKKKSIQKWIRRGILAAAVALLVLGVLQNGQTDVKNKAIRICYECIGIG